MMKRVLLMTLLAGGVATAQEPGASPGPATAAPQEGVIDPKADAALRRMSDYLSGLKTFRLEATSVDEKFTTEGQKIQELQASKLLVRRPAEMRVDRISPAGQATLQYDGKKISVHNKDHKVYATAAAPANLEETIDQARERLKIEAPGGDLLVTAPYNTLVEGLVTGRYIGLEPIDGVKAHHVAVTKDKVDWQIWIKDGPQPVPLRYVITSKDMPGHPQFTLEMRNWQPNAPVSADAFTFTPPSDAKRVEFAPPRRARR